MKTKSAFFKNKPLALCALVIVVVLVVSSCGRPPLVGTLDRSFGTNGIVTVDFGSDSDSGRSVLIQPDGKIVMLVTIQGGTPVLMRFNSDGNVDDTFGTDGKLSVTPINFGCKVALQSDEKLLVAGTSGGSLAVARYDSNGSGLDTSFGTNGIAKIPSDPGDFIYVCSDLAIQPDDKIVLVGTQESGGHTTTIVVARFTSDGLPDTTFAGNGLKFMDESDFPDHAYFRGEAVAIQPDEKIVLSANMYDSDTVEQIALARLLPDGSPDASTFGTNGKGAVAITLRNFYSSGGGLALQEDGKIVVLGNIFNPNEDLALARFNTNGELDPAFGGSGIVVTDFGQNENGNDLVIQTDGKIVVVGKISNAEGSDILLVRYNSDGSLDNTFGENGKVITDIDNTPDSGNSAALQTDKKLVVAGSTNGDAFLARYR
jgi:uncharacterized delta-60 repeat protein